MANSFTHDERTAFDKAVANFEDNLIISRNVDTWESNKGEMALTNNTIWIPQPGIMSTTDRVEGSNVTVQDVTERSVPLRIEHKKVTAFEVKMSDGNSERRAVKAIESAYQALASIVNTTIRDIVSLQGSLVVPQTAGTYAYSDVADIGTMMDEQGIPNFERYLALTSGSYNGLAGQLAGKELNTGKTMKAYEKAFVGDIAGLGTYRIDSGYSLAAAAGAGITIDTTGTTAGGNVKYVPTAETPTATGGTDHTDNRFQTITVSSTTGVKAGDAFTIAGVEAVHQITKESSGNLKTFRVISVGSATTMTITPAIVGAVGTTVDAETHYKNAEVSSTSTTAAITFLNTSNCNLSPFWYKDSIMIAPSGYKLPSDLSSRSTHGITKNGIEVLLVKETTNLTNTTRYTLDISYGVVNANPEMNGVLMYV